MTSNSARKDFKVMPDDLTIPTDPLQFIKECVQKRQILWTYHVNMRLSERAVTRQMVIESVENYEIIEEYPEDKYLPSYLVFTRTGRVVIHILFAVDVAAENVRVITAYRPSSNGWYSDLKRRK